MACFGLMTTTIIDDDDDDDDDDDLRHHTKHNNNKQKIRIHNGSLKTGQERGFIHSMWTQELYSNNNNYLTPTIFVCERENKKYKQTNKEECNSCLVVVGAKVEDGNKHTKKNKRDSKINHSLTWIYYN